MTICFHSQTGSPAKRFPGSLQKPNASLGHNFTLVNNLVRSNKELYAPGEEVVLTATPINLDEPVEFDTVLFAGHTGRMAIPYSLEQVVRTGILRFTPPDTGMYNVAIFAEKPLSSQRGDSLEFVKRIWVRNEE